MGLFKHMEGDWIVAVDSSDSAEFPNPVRKDEKEKGGNTSKYNILRFFLMWQKNTCFSFLHQIKKIKSV
jgi:hypothetical protein